ncbi:hypothetical protein [Lonepinella sp. MS14437]|uniref:hypothetical protein n=1 Tax=unclassified Lonepinella TaxID=2642006 RepID=UPI0036DCA657
METTLASNLYTVPKQESILYSEEELDVLYKIKNGLVKTKPHTEVMENLRKALNINED